MNAALRPLFVRPPRTSPALARCAGLIGAIALGLAGAAPASAATIYRCGQTYQQTPCPGGQTLTTDAGPTESQRQEAQDRADATKRLANDMTEDRRKQEAATAKARAKEEEAARKAERKAAAAASQAAPAPVVVAAPVLSCPAPVYIEVAPGDKRSNQHQGSCTTVIYVPKASAAAPVALQPAPVKK